MYVVDKIVSWKNTGLMPSVGTGDNDCNMWLGMWKDFVNGLILHKGFSYIKVDIDASVPDYWHECQISRRIFPEVYILKPSAMAKRWEVIQRARVKGVLLSVFVVKKSPEEYGKHLCYESSDPNPETEVPIWIATSDWDDLGF